VRVARTCGGGDNAGVDIDEEAAGSRVKLAVGATLNVRLLEQPTTGYRWALLPGDERVLALTEDTYHPDSERPGAGGIRHFRFTAGLRGHRVLSIVKRRSWESHETAAERVDLDVTVE